MWYTNSLDEGIEGFARSMLLFGCQSITFISYYFMDFVQSLTYSKVDLLPGCTRVPLFPRNNYSPSGI